jgi:putative membrane protein insertion efficiency factor
MRIIFLKLIRFYQIIISPFLGKHCRFEPSCSKYCYSAIEKYGPWKGMRQGLKRIARCNPWNPGGIDRP